jgi:type III restriction enzyme
MIKLPVVLTEHTAQWQDAVCQAVATRKKLAELATDEPEYVRPLLLIQAVNEGRPSDWRRE